MDLNVYAVEWLAAERVAELRARSARCALLRAGRPARPRWARRLAVALVRAGHWLGQGHVTRPRNAGVRLAR